MSGKASNQDRSVETLIPAITAVDIALLRQHLSEVIQGSAFKSSRRGQDFLKYVVEKVIEGNLDALKERAIGVELFARSPAYDTGEDAIVRVTASDVRRRLLQHYGEYGVTAGMRIELPPGTYIPEVRKVAEVLAQRPEAVSVTKTRIGRGAFALLALLGALSAVGLWKASSAREPNTTSVLPWPVFFREPHQTVIVTSDTDLVEIQDLTGLNIGLNDYANGKYIPDSPSLDEPTRQLSRRLRGDHSAAIDTEIALDISGVAQAYSRNVRARSARSLSFSDLQSDDNFIFLGSPRSNPWFALFEDQLDFSFDYDKALKKEVIRNKHPRLGELAVYVPTARGWETGQAFAIAAFIANPNQNGQVLLLAGSNAEGTLSAAKFVTDLPLLSETLGRNGIRSSGPVQHFEALLQLKTMAGSPRSFDVLAFHSLPGPG